MTRTIYETYARKVCAFFDMPDGTYPADHLNSAIMQLPFAEAHMELAGKTITDLPKLGGDISLQQHAQRVFFDQLADLEAPLFLQTQPFLIKAVDLAAIEHWREWKTLGIYLRQHGLEPCLVFRNQPHSLPVSYTEKVDWYVTDLRVLFGGAPFANRGHGTI